MVRLRCAGVAVLVFAGPSEREQLVQSCLSSSRQAANPITTGYPRRWRNENFVINTACSNELKPKYDAV